MSASFYHLRHDYPKFYGENAETSAHQAKSALNQEFKEKGRITGAVAMIYFPVSSEGPVPHCKLEIEGSCYTFRNLNGPYVIKKDPYSLDRKLQNISHAQIQKRNKEIGSEASSVQITHEQQRYIQKNLPQIQIEEFHKSRRELGVVRLSVVTTPKQLERMRNDIESIKATMGITCSHAVQRVLGKYTGYSVPFPLSIFPTTSALTMFATKKLGSERINRVDPYLFHRPKSMLCADAFYAIVPEIFEIFVSTRLILNGAHGALSTLMSNLTQ